LYHQRTIGAVRAEQARTGDGGAVQVRQKVSQAGELLGHQRRGGAAIPQLEHLWRDHSADAAEGQEGLARLPRICMRAANLGIALLMVEVEEVVIEAVDKRLEVNRHGGFS
jgi:hypothetical protein